MQHSGSTPPDESHEAHPGLNRSERDGLISQHLGLVHHVARQVAASGSGILDTDDLIGFGTIGLIQAIDRYDAGRGPSFVGYAVHRIRGAMLDAARTVDPLPRSVRQKLKRIDTARDALSLSLGREPRSAELCGATGLSEQEYRETQTVVSRLAVPLESVLGPGDSQDKSFGAALPGDPADEDFTEHIEQRELLNALEHAINYLPTRERLVLALYYKEDLTLAEIAPLLGVSESRISQLKYRALERLRAALQRDRAA